MDENNSIELKNDVIYLNEVTRVEVIDEKGRSYIKWDRNFIVQLSIQDDGKTLKIFLDKK